MIYKMLLGGVKPKTMFGSVLVEGNFGSGKTFFTEDEIYDLTWGNPDYLVISNIPIKRADILFNSKQDLATIIDYLYTYFAFSNNHLTELDKYKNILFIGDEIHIYFPARKSMDKTMLPIWDKLNVVLTQCRKRNIKFYFITQRVQKTDIEFRRLSEFIYFLNFNRFLGMPINRLSVIRAGGGISDLIGEDGATWESVEDLEKDVIYSGIAKHNTFLFRKERKMLHKDWPLWNEKYLTNYICGVDNINIVLEDGKFIDKGIRENSILDITFDDFYKKLLKVPSNSEPLLKIKNHDDIPIFHYGVKYLDFKGKVFKTVNNYY